MSDKVRATVRQHGVTRPTVYNFNKPASPGAGRAATFMKAKWPIEKDVESDTVARLEGDAGTVEVEGCTIGDLYGEQFAVASQEVVAAASWAWRQEGGSPDATLALVTKSKLYNFLWLKTITGFDQAEHCLKCLKGRRSELFPMKEPGFVYPAGYVYHGSITGAEPFVYLCGAANQPANYQRHLHVLMVRDETSAFVHEDAEVCVLVTGMRRLDIEPVPGADLIVPKKFYTCRNWQAGWHCFPDDRKPLAQVPGKNGTSPPHAARGRRKPPGTPEEPSSGT